MLAPGTTVHLDAAGVAENTLDTRTFWLGTDRFGRDYLSRVVAGSGLSLSVGIVAVLLSLLIGVPLGAFAGYLGGRFDDAVSWLLQVMWSIPTLLLVLAITLAFGKGFEQVFLAIGLSMWVDVARVVRGQAIALRHVEWVEAGRVLGLSTPRIVLGHILPNLAGPIAVLASANFAAAILIEAGLSFMGVGAQIPMPSWGTSSVTITEPSSPDTPISRSFPGPASSPWCSPSMPSPIRSRAPHPDSTPRNLILP